jgi:hypothetical protein
VKTSSKEVKKPHNLNSSFPTEKSFIKINDMSSFQNRVHS